MINNQKKIGIYIEIILIKNIFFCKNVDKSGIFKVSEFEARNLSH